MVTTVLTALGMIPFGHRMAGRVPSAITWAIPTITDGVVITITGTALIMAILDGILISVETTTAVADMVADTGTITDLLVRSLS